MYPMEKYLFPSTLTLTPLILEENRCCIHDIYNFLVTGSKHFNS